MLKGLENVSFLSLDLLYQKYVFHSKIFIMLDFKVDMIKRCYGTSAPDYKHRRVRFSCTELVITDDDVISLRQLKPSKPNKVDKKKGFLQ